MKRNESQILRFKHFFDLQCINASCFFRNQECPRQESNLYLEFRKPSFYPLNYGDQLISNKIGL